MLAPTVARSSAEGEDAVLEWFAELDEPYVVERVEEIEGERTIRLRSADAVERGAGGVLFRRAVVTITRHPDVDAATGEVARRLAAADPDTGLSYAWDFVTVDENRVLHLGADCTFTEATFKTVAAAMARAAGAQETAERSSFWCRCGAGCRRGAPFEADPPLVSSLPLVRHEDPLEAEDEAYDNRLDPSGSWTSEIGDLSLMHYADRLSFTYLAVFGPTAHICEGAGVAGLVGRDRYEYVDEQGTVEFVLAEDAVRMEVVEGIASFCGAGWAGDRFAIAGFALPVECRVTAERAQFHAVEVPDPERRPAWVTGGDRIEAVAARSSSARRWVLARFAGSRATTVGLLDRAELTCAAAPW